MKGRRVRGKGRRREEEGEGWSEEERDGGKEGEGERRWRVGRWEERKEEEEEGGWERKWRDEENWWSVNRNLVGKFSKIRDKLTRQYANKPSNTSRERLDMKKLR